MTVGSSACAVCGHMLRLMYFSQLETIGNEICAWVLTNQVYLTSNLCALFCLFSSVSFPSIVLRYVEKSVPSHLTVIHLKCVSLYKV